MTTTQIPIGPPPGYWRDAKGNLIRDELVRPLDKEADAVVRRIVAEGYKVRDTLTAFKAMAFAEVSALVELTAEQYDAKIGGDKGNVTLHTFDGRYKLQRANSDAITFDQRLVAAKALIDECLAEWTVGARPEVQTIINDAFQTDKEGNISVGKVLSLRRLEIKDSRWQQAMLAISEATLVIGSKSYIRIYERSEATGKYLPIALDVAGA